MQIMSSGTVTTKMWKKYTQLQVHASSLSQAGGIHKLWVSSVVRGEKHIPIRGCIFSKNVGKILAGFW